MPDRDEDDYPRSPAAEVYGNAVADILDAQPRDSSYRPERPLRLRITNRRQPHTPEALLPAERRQLQGLMEEAMPLGGFLADEEFNVEVAEVVDEDTGQVRFRLYGWDFGVGYLFAAEGDEIIAFGAQHDLEHWRLSQRPIFYAMDAALRAGGHGFQQPLSFCWWRQECWDEIADAEPGTVGSEPYLRRSRQGAG